MQDFDESKTQKQLTFSLSARSTPTFENFFVGSNALVLSALHSAVLGQGEHFIYLWGESGVGRSHLLQAACSAVSEQSRVGYWDFSHHPDIGPEVLQGWEEKEVVCLDNIDTVLGNITWEKKLFCLYNNLLENAKLLIVSANQPAVSLQCVLQDLYSRLNAGLILWVRPLSDEEKVLFLCGAAKKRGLTLPQLVAEYLVRHENRALVTLLEILDRVEQATLEHKRRVTLPFVKEVIAGIK